jgi:hypothetical protein
MGIVLVSLVAAIVVIGLLRLADALEPQIGDIISFDSRQRASIIAREEIVVARVGEVPGADCVLDSRVVHASGGSILIEAYRPRPRPLYFVHWVGIHTSAGAGDCGSVADLMLSRMELAELMSAAAGSIVTSSSAFRDQLSVAAATTLN